ncbi:MAG: exodeoxyribonuclease VII large subunit [Christensenella sp.]|nr:exodeoxyribonuclease VII large subunit [Christensenella sp.]
MRASSMDELVLSVYELNTYVADKLSGDPFLEEIWVKGEVSDVSIRQGAVYFVLRDEASTLDCMLFENEDTTAFLETLEEGRVILVRGDVSVYWKNGRYRLVVKEMQLAGLGELYARFLQLKERLQKLGAFDESHKKPIPRYPKKIGIVTSLQGAAIQDIRHIASRRNPSVKLLLYPVKVQGVGAAEQIAHAIDYFNDETDVDVLIVGRGGGSAEDLFAFNEEEVVMAVYHSVIPVVSAVGHETDYSLSDMAADLRAPTPSAAAELTIPERSEIEAGLLRLWQQIRQNMRGILNSRQSNLAQYAHNLHKDFLMLRVREQHTRLDSYSAQIKERVYDLYKKIFSEYTQYKTIIENLGPAGILERGYSVAMLGKKEVRSIGDVQVGDKITVMLKDGSLLAVIEGKEE